MQRKVVLSSLFFLALVALLGARCPQIPELVDYDVSVPLDAYIELVFEARGSINVHSDADTIDIISLRDDLRDAGIEVGDVDTAWVTNVLYGVVAYNETPVDREIVDGTVTVIREDDGTSAVLFSDVDAEVYPLLGLLVPAPIEPAGVDFVNELLADALTALKDYSVSEFVVAGEASGVSEPQGRYTDFDWRVRIEFQVVGRATVEKPEF